MQQHINAMDYSGTGTQVLLKLNKAFSNHGTFQDFNTVLIPLHCFLTPENILSR